MTTNPDLDQAREVAGTVTQYPKAYDPGMQAVARVIASLPEEWIDADKLRETIEFHRDRLPHGAEEDLEALLPAPQARSLADTKWDDNVHPYMEAVTVSGRRHILLAPMGDTSVSGNTILVADHDGGIPVLVPADGLFPTGRYARLSLPEEQATEETPEVEEGIYGQALWDMFTKAIRDEKEYHIDAQDYEGVKRWRDAERALRTALETNPPKEANPPKETPDLPEPEDAPDGYYLVHWWGEEHPVPAEKVQGQWWVIGKETFLHPKDVFIVSRLVMEGKQA